MPRHQPDLATASAARPTRIRTALLLVLVLAVAASVVAAIGLRACRPGTVPIAGAAGGAVDAGAAVDAGNAGNGGDAGDAGDTGGRGGESAAGRAGPAGASAGRGAGAASGPTGAARERRVLAGSFATAGARRLLLDFPPGIVSVEPAATEAARVTVEVECEPGCAAARRLRLGSAREGGGTLRLYLAGWPQGPPWRRPAGGLTGAVHVQAPPGLALGGDLGPCSLELTRLDGPFSLLSSGLHLRIAAPAASLGAARLATWWGDTLLLAPSERRRGGGLLGSDLSWRRGRPGAELGVECAFGSVELAIGPERPPRLPAGTRRPG
jgi:hypothetical protein